MRWAAPSGAFICFDIPNLFAFLMWRPRQTANLLLIHHLVLEREIMSMMMMMMMISLLFSVYLRGHFFSPHPLPDLLTPSLWFLSDNLNQSFASSLFIKAFTFVILPHICCLAALSQQTSSAAQEGRRSTFMTAANSPLVQHYFK